jgi:hypothetical protein
MILLRTNHPCLRVECHTNELLVKGQEDKVCKLQKSLYGLKQAPKKWHEKFDITHISAGFSVNETDRCMDYRHGGVRLLYCAYISMTY